MRQEWCFIDKIQLELALGIDSISLMQIQIISGVSSLCQMVSC